MTIYLRASSPMRSSDTAEADGQPCVPPHLAPDGVYMTDESPGRRCALTAPFHPYQAGAWRYLSVALALESPPPAVNWHPCPVVLGLSSFLSGRPEKARGHPTALPGPYCTTDFPFRQTEKKNRIILWKKRKTERRYIPASALPGKRPSCPPPGAGGCGGCGGCCGLGGTWGPSSETCLPGRR